MEKPPLSLRRSGMDVRCSGRIQHRTLSGTLYCDSIHNGSPDETRDSRLLKVIAYPETSSEPLADDDRGVCPNSCLIKCVLAPASPGKGGEVARTAAIANCLAVGLSTCSRLKWVGNSRSRSPG